MKGTSDRTSLGVTLIPPFRTLFTTESIINRMMYWIEVYFENGKTLRKESNSLNEIYQVLCRYDVKRKHLRVQGIRSGRDSTRISEINKTEGIII